MNRDKKRERDLDREKEIEIVRKKKREKELDREGGIKILIERDIEILENRDRKKDKIRRIQITKS